MTLHSLEVDARTGGSYRLDFGDGMVFFGRYLEVTPHSRIVWTNDGGGENSSVTTVTFEEKDDNTLLTVAEVYAAKEAIDEVPPSNIASQQVLTKSGFTEVHRNGSLIRYERALIAH